MAEISPSPDPRAPARPHVASVIDVTTLLGGRPEVRLVHRGVEYRLRVTRQGKLLLTK
jgi:hemin uptake protein HemP